MFDVGIFEMAVIAIVALIVLGPERLPKAARYAGLWVRKARAQWYSVKSEFEREMAADELRRSLAAQASELREDLASVQKDVAAAGREVADSGRELAEAGRVNLAGEEPTPADSAPPLLPSAEAPPAADSDAAPPPGASPAEPPR